MRIHSVGFLVIALGFQAAAAAAADFTVTNANDNGVGSLRQAITDANAHPGADRIVFNIPGSGVHKISVAQDQTPYGGAGLPTITETVVIDGYTQAGAKPNDRQVGDDAVILIQLQPSDPYALPGLLLHASNCVIKGLALTGFGQSGSAGWGAIVIEGDSNHIEGNFIGLAPNGSTNFSGADGITVYFSNGVPYHDNVIGGTGPSQRNVIAGQFRGVVILGGHNIVFNNYIGTDASGTLARPNMWGFYVYGPCVIGDVLIPGSGNLISGNETGGILQSGTSVELNWIGVQSDHVSPLGNTFQGLSIGSSGSRIANNLIAFSGTVGVGVVQSNDTTSNQIVSNNIYSNGTLPIDLSYDGVTLNDPGDADNGPNGLQNYPIITSAVSDPNTSTVRLKGIMQSTPSTQFTLEFFHFVPTGEVLFDRGRGESGTSITTDANGNAGFDLSFTYTLSPGPDGEFFGTTATGPTGTSEMMVTNGPVQLANLSTRGHVETGDRILIGGFVVRSNTPKRIGIRALGPSVNAPDKLSDPYLELHDGSGMLLAKNDDWRSGQEQDISNSHLAPQSDVESALIATLAAGNYTAQVRGANGSVGTALVEIYDLDAFPASAGRLLNLSTRGVVGTGDNVLIGGTILRGANAEQLVVRAIGPDLTAEGVRGALNDPMLELHDGNGALLASNDNWRDSQEAELQASGVAPGDDRDSAILASLPPAPYTAVVRGKNDSTGVALVEFYDLTN